MKENIMGYRVVVAGATGAVGREMLQTLAERNFPADEVFALASTNSSGREISYGDDKVLKVQSLETFDFSKADIALFSAGGAISEAYAPKAGAAGCIVIDNSSAFRMADDVPLIRTLRQPGDANDVSLFRALGYLKMRMMCHSRVGHASKRF